MRLFVQFTWLLTTRPGRILAHMNVSASKTKVGICLAK